MYHDWYTMDAYAKIHSSQSYRYSTRGIKTFNMWLITIKKLVTFLLFSSVADLGGVPGVPWNPPFWAGPSTKKY